MMRIDAHQHFWKYEPAGYGWISEDMTVLQRDYLPADLLPLLRAGEFDGAIAVQARQTETETRWLLELAEANDTICGVVGWVDLCGEDVAERLTALQHPRLCGMRHILQDEADDEFMLRPEFRRGLRALKDAGIPYDVLVAPRHLPHVHTLVRELDGVSFVVDHLAKPLIREQRTSGWEDDIRRVADHPSVFCKVSGMVTEADWDTWQPEHLVAYLDVVFDAFGPERLMFGSDWPVCLLAAPYHRVLGIVADYTRDLDSATRGMIFGGTAARFYGLEVRT